MAETRCRRRYRATPTERFLKKVDKNGPVHPICGQCWTWMGCHNNGGYGNFYLDGKIIKAHKFSYMEFVWAVPTGLQVLHRCDNPSCVNPAHLFLGTNADNMADKIAKGRQAKGSGRVGRKPLAVTKEVFDYVKANYVKSSRRFGAEAISRRLKVSTQMIYACIRKLFPKN